MESARATRPYRGTAGHCALLGAHPGRWCGSSLDTLRRGSAHDTGRQCRVWEKHAEHDALRPRCARCQQARIAIGIQPLAHGLERLPALTARSRDRQANRGKLLGASQIGDMKVCDRVGPQIAWERHLWRDRELGKVPVPLRPHTGGLVTQIQRIHNAAALPAVITGGSRPNGRVSTSRNMSQPPAGDGGQLDTERHKVRTRRAIPDQ